MYLFIKKHRFRLAYSILKKFGIFLVLKKRTLVQFLTDTQYILLLKLLLKLTKRNLNLLPANSFSDGVGAQVQRLLSLYSLSQFLGANFIFRPLRDVDIQLNDSLERIESKSEYLNEVNSDIKGYFAKHQILTDVETNLGINLYSVRQAVKVIVCNPLSSEQMNLFLDTSYGNTPLVSTKGRLLKIYDPYLERCQASNVLKVHLHLRISNFTEDSHRTTNPKFYLHTLSQILNILHEMNLSYAIEVFSDFDIDGRRDEFLSDFATKKTQEHVKNISLLDSNGKISAHVTSQVSLITRELFALDKNLSFHNNTSPFRDMCDMSECDILIGSKSSFSFVAASLQHRLLNIFPRSWNKSPNSWILLDGKSPKISPRKYLRIKRALRKYQKHLSQIRPIH